MKNGDRVRHASDAVGEGTFIKVVSDISAIVHWDKIGQCQAALVNLSLIEPEEVLGTCVFGTEPHVLDHYGLEDSCKNWKPIVPTGQNYDASVVLEDEFDNGGTWGEEIRVKDPETGGEKGRKALELGFVDSVALEELGRVASYGTKKYSPFNYLKGYSWMLNINAMYRHILKFLGGEDRDFSVCDNHEEWSFECPDCGSGLLHVVHASWHGLALASFILRKRGTDDRAQ